MYFTIQETKTNKPIFRGKLEGFGTHTSCTEISGNQCFYAHLKDVEVIKPLQLKEFESTYRLKLSNYEESKRTYYIFSQPKLRSDFMYIITKDGYQIKIQKDE